MTILWFVVWLIADHVGDRESIVFDPANVWAVTLLLAVVLDLNRPRVPARRGR